MEDGGTMDDSVIEPDMYSTERELLQCAGRQWFAEKALWTIKSCCLDKCILARIKEKLSLLT